MQYPQLLYKSYSNHPQTIHNYVLSDDLLESLANLCGKRNFSIDVTASTISSTDCITGMAHIHIMSVYTQPELIQGPNHVIYQDIAKLNTPIWKNDIY